MGNLIARKPISVLNRPLKVDFKDLFKALAKFGLAGATQNWDGIMESVVDAATALSLGQNPAQVAWLLIYRSLERAIYSLMRDNFDLFVLPSVVPTLPECLNSLESAEISIDDNFFNAPKQLPVLNIIQPALTEWLQLFGVELAQAQAMSNRLPSYFSEALEEEWRARNEQYKCLLELDTPFTKANERERAWRRYRAYLQKQIAEPMFGEAFSLQQVYVPLRAYSTRKKKDDHAERGEPTRYQRTEEKQNLEKVVVEMDSAILTWLKEADKDDALRVICGGPGCGKSSYTKMLAAHLAETLLLPNISLLPVVYIPLHLFKLEGDLFDSLTDYFSKGLFESLPPNPLQQGSSELRTLLIFDGLDELAMQGKLGTELAQQFIREVKDTLRRLNHETLHLQVLISGRDVAVQSSGQYLTQEGQVLHVLPYFVPEKSRAGYVDNGHLLPIDQRERWWRNYGAVSGSGHTCLPQELSSQKLTEITAQPLLNYLIALSLRNNPQGINFSDETNLNQIYAHLLNCVYQRGWASGQHPALEGIKEDDFVLILEEIALSTWHGNGRTTSVRAIEEHCQLSGPGSLLNEIKQGAEAGVLRLLAAFYFRQQGSLTDGEKTFEFTHKSFGEYLTAKRIVRGLEIIHEEIQIRKNSRNRGWDEKTALTEWAMLCGPSPLDPYLLEFIVNEVAFKSIDLVSAWQKVLCDLIGVILKQGMPMERLDPRPSFQEEHRQARNAEEALLCMLNACARKTQLISKIDWDDNDNPVTFANWLKRLSSQTSIDGDIPMVYKCLGFLDISHCNLSRVELSGADLSRADLSGAALVQANLIQTILDGANLSGAALVQANLAQANLDGANLSGAALVQANLIQTNLDGANLIRADLVQANLVQANLDGANLSGADLVQANLVQANLIQTNLSGANLILANLVQADLKNISWDKNTTWSAVQGLESALNVPPDLLEQLGISPALDKHPS